MEPAYPSESIIQWKSFAKEGKKGHKYDSVEAATKIEGLLDFALERAERNILQMNTDVRTVRCLGKFNADQGNAVSSATKALPLQPVSPVPSVLKLEPSLTSLSPKDDQPVTKQRSKPHRSLKEMSPVVKLRSKPGNAVSSATKAVPLQPVSPVSSFLRLEPSLTSLSPKDDQPVTKQRSKPHRSLKEMSPVVKHRSKPRLSPKNDPPVANQGSANRSKSHRSLKEKSPVVKHRSKPGVSPNDVPSVAKHRSANRSKPRHTRKHDVSEASSMWKSVNRKAFVKCNHVFHMPSAEYGSPPKNDSCAAKHCKARSPPPTRNAQARTSKNRRQRNNKSSSILPSPHESGSSFSSVTVTRIPPSCFTPSSSSSANVSDVSESNDRYRVEQKKNMSCDEENNIAERFQSALTTADPVLPRKIGAANGDQGRTMTLNVNALLKNACSGSSHALHFVAECPNFQADHMFLNGRLFR